MNYNLGINIAGYINSEFGIGEGVRANIRAASAVGIPFVINNFTRSPHRKQDTTYQNFSDDNPHPVNLIQVNADEVATFIKHTGSSYFENKYNIGFWAWELPAFPPAWQPAFNHFHEIWTYSNHCAEAISAVSPIPVIKIMPSISLAQSALERKALNLPKDKFIFLFVFDFSSRIERKNPLAAIQAFKQAFGQDDSVLLIVKSSNSKNFPEAQASLNSAIANCANIKHLDGYLSKEKINGLLYNCDCYVSLHRCEGFGLTMAEAMFYGKPVIATGYSSNTEFMNVGNSFLVKYKLIPIEQDCGPYKKGNVWAAADVEHATNLMRFVFNNSQEAQQVGAIAAEEIQTLLNPQVIGNKIKKRLEYIAEITDNFQNLPLSGIARMKSAKMSPDLDQYSLSLRGTKQSYPQTDLHKDSLSLRGTKQSHPQVDLHKDSLSLRGTKQSHPQVDLHKDSLSLRGTKQSHPQVDLHKDSLSLRGTKQSHPQVDLHKDSLSLRGTKQSHPQVDLHKDSLSLRGTKQSHPQTDLQSSHPKSQSKTELKNWQPKVSICIPTYNGEAFIEETIKSALAQTYSNIELIISDDGSTDRTIAIAQTFQSQTTADFRIILHRNYGLSQNWNFCISQATGEYIKFLFQDDLLEPECIEKMVALAQQNPEIGMVFSPRAITIAEDESHPILRKASQSIKDLHKSWSNLKSIQPGKELLADTNCLSNPINKIGEPSTVLIAARVFAEIGLFDSGLSQYVDLDMWWRIMGNYHIGFVDEKLSSLRIHPEQQTWKNFAAGENHKDVVRFYKKLLNSPEYSFLNPEIKQTIRQKLALRTQPNLSDLSALIEQYKKSPSNQSLLAKLRQYRQQVAEYWLNLPAEKLESAYSQEPGKAHKLLLSSALKYETLIESEQSFVQQLSSKLAEGGEVADKIQYVLAAMLYCDAYELPLEYQNAAIPQWFFDDFLKFLFQSPSYFQQKWEVERYSAYFQQLIQYVAANIATFPDSDVWRYLAAFIAQNVSFQALYLSEANLLNVLSQRADILEFHLKNIGCQIDWTFAQREPESTKIRVGFLLDKISSETEIFAAIPAFEYLDRDKFEVILYDFQVQDERLGKYCASCADKLVQLSEDLSLQVQEVRSHNLDILLICSNIAETSQTTALLCLHRLARVQMATAASNPATTAARNIDYLIAGDLTLPADAAQYREKLITLEGSGVCFSYPVPSAPATVEPTRSSWGATDESIVFMSSTPAFKIIPELRETWTKIIAAVPNSILVLYPFRSRPENYPTVPFYHQIRSTFGEFGIDKQRVVVIRALPNRADCIKCLELADIYLDSYPDSGADSLVEPLLAGLPVVARKGQKIRSRQFAAVLEELQLPELVADSENSYIELSTALGTNPELRRRYRDRVQQKMAANPKFLDSRAYCHQIAKLFERNP